MKRLFFLLAAMILATTACGSTDNYAAKVNGDIVSTKTVLDELHTITSNPRYVAVLNEQLGRSGQTLQPGGDNTVNASYTSQIVFNRILVSLIERAAVKEGVTASVDDTAAAEKSVREDLGDDSMFNNLPQSYRTYLIDRQAKLQAIMAKRGSPEAALAYYNSHLNTYATYCVRHILVNDKPLADALRNQILNGTSFATLATQNSTDNQGEDSSAAKGGDLGCYSGTDLGQFIAPFRDAVLSATPNTVSEPVQTQFGYHLIEVTSKTQQTFEQAKADVTRTIADPGDYLAELVKDAKITVNPRFGTYQPADASTGASARIVPPAANTITTKTTEAPLPPTDSIPLQ